MNIMNILQQIIAKYNAQKKSEFDAQQRQTANKRHEDDYSLLALLLQLVVCENSEQLGVMNPAAPSRLCSSERVDNNVFLFILTRKTSNRRGTENAVTRYEICMILQRILRPYIQGHFEVFCFREDDSTYTVTFKSYGATIKGLPQHDIGLLFVDKVIKINNYGQKYYFNFFNIKFYDGTTHGMIPDNTQLLVYAGGEFIPSTTLRDGNGYVYLSRKPSSAPYYGYYVKL